MHCMQPGFDHQPLQLNPNLALFGTSHWHRKHLLHLLDPFDSRAIIASQVEAGTPVISAIRAAA